MHSCNDDITLQSREEGGAEITVMKNSVSGMDGDAVAVGEEGDVGGVVVVDEETAVEGERRENQIVAGWEAPVALSSPPWYLLMT